MALITTSDHWTYRIAVAVIKLVVLVIGYHWSKFIGVNLQSFYQLDVDTHVVVISKS